MQKKQPELPMHIYHRIYRFARRNVDADRIALTLDLPLKTVQRVLDRFAQSEEGLGPEIEQEAEKEPETFLDIYIIPKVRYIVADISGWITGPNIEKIQSEFDKLSKSQWKVIALLMRDVMNMDEKGLEAVLTFRDNLAARSRYCAILDPSRSIEAFIDEHQLDERIPIFGTEKTFEDEAFSTRRASMKPRPGTAH
jgi:hypothetical protein